MLVKEVRRGTSGGYRAYLWMRFCGDKLKASSLACSCDEAGAQEMSDLHIEGFNDATLSLEQLAPGIFYFPFLQSFDTFSFTVCDVLILRNEG